MKIDFNEKGCKAMEAFSKGDFKTGSELQGKFVEELKRFMREKNDYCSCKADCKYHGQCVICVQIHRGHGQHLPQCMQLMLNKKIAALSELSEHSIIKEVDIPDYLK